MPNLSVSRPITPGCGTNEHTIIDLDRSIDLPTPSEELQPEGIDTAWSTPRRSEVTSEVLGQRDTATIDRPVTSSEPDGTSDSAGPDAETERRVGRRLAEPSEQADLWVALTTRSVVQPPSEPSTRRRG
ncbi:hypothetical protein [Haladaptatus sp. NG-SE-30]